ncbi:SDR family oxidoreductase [Corynebacterium anserum]|uniref:SDR family oxidoreductase n=1 Tax=Corynebacterium anserum TaxID=2684406 RepID=A0A7G7YPR2_9CORY|nr:SDR family oxidoreductase [Corynebacterium anserum]MBC2682124.1 SDR family oxidoreductase [Corynebacterium anserum]QNH96482.1 SDR family oxidoreductase [Corynebacterium anserum]
MFDVKNVLSKFRSNQLKGGSIVITGAAQGFGRAIAEKFAQAGWSVGAYDVDVARLSDWAESAANVTWGELDVRDADAWQRTLEEFAESHGGAINVVVNNAGVLYSGDFVEKGSFDADARLVDINVKGVLFGARAAFPYLKKAASRQGGNGVRGAHLVNLCSASAIYGTPDMATYSATKFAVRGISEALEVEWDGHGVQVSDIIPLYVKTGMLENEHTVGMDRLGVQKTPEDVADVVFKVVTRGRGVPAKVHNPVGAQPGFLLNASFMSPAFLTRFVNGKLVYEKKVRF